MGNTNCLIGNMAPYIKEADEWRKNNARTYKEKGGKKRKKFVNILFEYLFAN